MRRIAYDYSGFSLKRLREPRFRHILLLAGWIGYFSLYFITEKLIPAEKCHVIHCALDDLIPFNEFFAIFYVLWYLLVFGSLAYTLLGFLGVPRHDIETDWESTFYPTIPDDAHEKEPDFWCLEAHFNNGFMKYGNEGDTWQRRIELYLLDCGLSPDELARLRGILLEEVR